MSSIKKTTKNKWFLQTSELFREEQHVIDWDKLLPEKIGSKHQREYLLKSCKSFMMAMIEAPRIVRGNAASSGTILSWFRHIRRLVEWMTARDIWRFSALSADDVISYLDQSINPRNVSRGRGKSSYRTYLQLMQQLWDLRLSYAAPIRVNVATLYLDAEWRTRQPTPWKAIDESIALPLIKDAIYWLEEFGDFLLCIKQRQFEFFRRSVGKTKKEMKRGVSFSYANLPNELEYKCICNSLRIEGEKPGEVIDAATRIAEGACIVVILFLVGIRVRELTSLNIDCVEPTDSEGIVTFQLNGIAAKANGVHRKWAITEPVIIAVQFLRKIFEYNRFGSSRSALLVQPKGRGVTTMLRQAGRMTPVIVSKRLKTFANARFRDPIPDGTRIHPHAARKTFARFVVLRDKRALESLSYHFGHVHRAITDGSYVGGDIALEELLSEESRRDLANGLEDILTSSHLGGKAGQKLRTIKDDSEMNSHFHGRKTLSNLIEKLIDDGVQLAPCDWGYCVYSAALSACHGDSKGPNSVFRAPDVCASCSNFTVTERHRSWWESRFDREEQFLKRENISPQARQVVVRRLGESKRVLSNLNSSHKTIQMPLSHDENKERS